MVGLLDGLVIRELELERHGYRVFDRPTPTSGARSPTARSVALFLDGERTAAHLRENGFSERRHPRA